VDVKSSEQLFLSFNLGDCYVSAFVTNTPKTPSSILSTKNTDKKDVHRSSRKTPISKKKLHFNLDTIQEDRSSCSDYFADLPDLHFPFKKIKLEFFAPKIQEHVTLDRQSYTKGQEHHSK
jgi:hypothetical protein